MWGVAIIGALVLLATIFFSLKDPSINPNAAKRKKQAEEDAVEEEDVELDGPEA